MGISLDAIILKISFHGRNTYNFEFHQPFIGNTTINPYPRLHVESNPFPQNNHPLSLGYCETFENQCQIHPLQYHPQLVSEHVLQHQIYLQTQIHHLQQEKEINVRIYE